MLRIFAHAALLIGALALGACGFADSRAPVPEFMRMKEAEQPPPEAPPDVKRVVRDQIDVVFLATSYPREVHVARRPDLHRDDQRRQGRGPPARGRRRYLRDGDLRADLEIHKVPGKTCRSAGNDHRLPFLLPPRAVSRRT
jgi:hypothetical protein